MVVEQFWCRYDLVMSKRKSIQMERMSRGRSGGRVTNKELYAVSPPRLTKAENCHFRFGSVTEEVLFGRIDSILRASSRASHTASKVANALNRANKKTACGEKWDRRLAWFAMRTWQDVQAQVDRPLSVTKDRPIDRAVRQQSDNNYRKHLKKLFETPKIGGKFHFLADLLAQLKKSEF
jgi:hypothetical protein